MSPDRIVRARRVITPEGTRAASVHVKSGRIEAVLPFDAPVPAGCAVDDVPDEQVLLPGVVDTHVHVNEPGRTEWEGFASATRAAAAGGVTTIMDMPLNSVPPTTTAPGYEAKALAAEGKCVVDVALAGGLVPDNAHAPGALATIAARGARAFKCFLAPSGVDEFGHVGEDDLAAGMRELARLGLPLLVHAELPGPLDDAAAAQGEIDADEARRYRAWLLSRPKRAEEAAVEMVLRLAKRHGARAHVVHLSAASALPLLSRAREEGAQVTVETCPHYLSFAAEEIADGATPFKCAPPIREADNREALWGALREGFVDQVVTDHSPSTATLKCIGSGDFTKAWGGIASLQLGLAAVWTGARARGATLEHVVRWMCAGPAALIGLVGKKGVIAPGADADLAAFDPEAVMAVSASRLEHKNKVTPYEGRKLHGVVRRTWLRGETIYEAGAFVGAPRGGLLA